MSDIISVLEEQGSLFAGDGTPEYLIKEAEKMLKLNFADDYHEYLGKYGIVAFRGHEFTGITKSPRLNVVAVTFAEREKNSSIPQDMYVVECTNVEEIVIWQKSTGEIYYSGPNQPLVKYCDSLSEFIKGKTQSNEGKS